jgi:hypothetical protein
MTDLTRQQVLDTLEHEWGTYVERYRKLSPEAQQAFVARQGYERFADILAHVGAWWRDAISTIRVMVDKPDQQVPELDVDSYNARAVGRMLALDEAAVAQFFETIRTTFVELVTALPDSAFADPRISDQLYIEVIEHLDEHALPEDSS